ncbi:GntR family transcriptional regulator [Streptomyces sp. NPDC002564]|uniref:GntR family transcriptional regulator n=1 Tax=Streptomyces sp. NPDC002564 TaxID=3364649 RepID=UPI00369B4B57
MSSVSSPGTYQRIAFRLTQELDDGRIAEGSRLPSERELAARFQVARATVRAALELLRDQGLVVTSRRGTFAARAYEASGPDRQKKAAPSPFLVASGRGAVSGYLFVASVRPSLADHLGLVQGSAALHYRHSVQDPLTGIRQRAVTYFTSVALTEIPQLFRYLPRIPVADPDLSAFSAWCQGAGLTPGVSESVTFTPADSPHPSAAPQLAVRRWCHDQHERLLCLTELDLPRGEVTLEYAGHASMRAARRSHRPQAAHASQPAGPERAGV